MQTGVNAGALCLRSALIHGDQTIHHRKSYSFDTRQQQTLAQILVMSALVMSALVMEHAVAIATPPQRGPAAQITS